ncbi:MAG: hypothetical protein AAGJ11_19195 [Bacteroidota bacterium]
MIERDFLMRQIAQFVQVLAAVVAGKGRGDLAEAQQILEAGLHEAGLPLAEIRAMSRAEVEALVTEDGMTLPEKAVSLADLLREDAEAAGRVRARWLYQVALDAGGPVPFDVQARIDALPEAA